MSELADSRLEAVYEAILLQDPDGARMAGVIRGTLDQLYDGQHTGRYRWDQLFKTEKTHCGTLVEINLQREFQFADGEDLDYSILGHDVDCKYSQKFGGWMIPSEAHGKLCLIVTADDARATWSAGVVRARTEWLNLGRNRDMKATLNAAARDLHVKWLQRDAALPPNVLLTMSSADLDAIFGKGSGQQRLDELFRRATGLRIGRGVVATVAQQSDYMKRVRGNGGSRSRLQPEGFLVLGDSQAHRLIAVSLNLPSPAKGETVSVRVVKAEAEFRGADVAIAGNRWRVAGPGDPTDPGPILPNPRMSEPSSILEQVFELATSEES